MLTVGEALQHSENCFIHDFVFQVISEKALRSKDLTSYLTGIFI